MVRHITILDLIKYDIHASNSSTTLHMYELGISVIAAYKKWVSLG